MGEKLADVKQDSKSMRYENRRIYIDEYILYYVLRFVKNGYKNLNGLTCA